MEKIYRVKLNSKGMPNFATAVEIDTDISEYSDRPWKNAYERGKADRPQGEWIDKGKNLWKCSNCEMVIYSESEQDRNEYHKWCSRCGARMKGADDE